MTVFSPIVTLFYNLTGNFFAAIIISALLFSLLALPVFILSRKHKQKKRLIDPKIRELRSKYHATTLGVYTDDDEHLDPEIRAMNKDERAEALAKELSDLYKKEKYHAYVGWIPGIVYLVLTFFLYGAVSGAIPEGSFYGDSIWNLIRSGRTVVPTITFFVGLAVPISQIAIEGINILRGQRAKKVRESIDALNTDAVNNAKLTDADKKQIRDKSKIIALVIPLILTVGLGIFIGIRVSTAIAILVIALQIIRFVFPLIFDSIAEEVKKKKSGSGVRKEASANG